MTDPIQAAIDALDYLPTPKKLEGRTEWALGVVGKYFRADASEVEVDEALQISMILAFFIRKIYKDNTRLSKWQKEAVEMLKNENLYLYKSNLSEKEYQINLDTIDRLIAEAEGE